MSREFADCGVIISATVVVRKGRGRGLTPVLADGAEPRRVGIEAQDGWTMVLSGLKTLLETGKPLGA